MISSRFLLFSVVLAFFIFSCSSEEDGEPVIIVEPTFSIAFNESIVDGTLTIKPNEVVQVEVTFDYGTTGETLLTITDNLSTDIGQLTWTNLNTLIGAERGILVGEFTPSELAVDDINFSISINSSSRSFDFNISAFVLSAELEYTINGEPLMGSYNILGQDTINFSIRFDFSDLDEELQSFNIELSEEIGAVTIANSPVGEQDGTISGYYVAPLTGDQSVTLSFQLSNSSFDYAESFEVAIDYRYEAPTLIISDEINGVGQWLIIINSVAPASMSTFGGFAENGSLDFSTFNVQDSTIIMDTVLYTQPPTGTTDELVFTIVDKQGLEASENLSLMFCAQDYLVGSYMLEQTIGSPDPFFGEATKFAEETVTIKASNDGSRIIELTWLGFSSEMVIFADCNSSEILIFEHSGAGASCGTPVIWAPDEENGIVIDDDTFAVRFIDDFENTCGLQESMELTFTRQ